MNTAAFANESPHSGVLHNSATDRQRDRISQPRKDFPCSKSISRRLSGSLSGSLFAQNPAEFSWLLTNPLVSDQSHRSHHSLHVEWLLLRVRGRLVEPAAQRAHYCELQCSRDDLPSADSLQGVLSPVRNQSIYMVHERERESERARDIEKTDGFQQRMCAELRVYQCLHYIIRG